MRFRLGVITFGACCWSLSFAQSPSSAQEVCVDQTVNVTNGLGQVVQTRTTRRCGSKAEMDALLEGRSPPQPGSTSAAKTTEPIPGEMTKEQIDADLARLKVLAKEYQENSDRMRAIEEKYFTPEERQRLPARPVSQSALPQRSDLANACIASHRNDGWSESSAVPWCTCVSQNLAGVLTAAERERYLANAVSFIDYALSDPPAGQQRNWRLYSPVGSCQN
jgi:hypothetical protein